MPEGHRPEPRTISGIGRFRFVRYHAAEHTYTRARDTAHRGHDRDTTSTMPDAVRGRATARELAIASGVRRIKATVG